MTVRIGVIADDLTGATDIAGFLAAHGLPTVQFTSAEALDPSRIDGAEAIVLGLKTRSIPAEEAVAMSLDALDRLRAAGAERIVFKYCSTFDSTAEGNIGPVTDALLERLGAEFTVLCPALPVNGRTVYQGTLFVGDRPLAESGMRDHPLTPMRDSNLARVMGAQASGRAGLVPFATVERGVDAVREALAELRAEGHRYAVLDCLTDAHLDVLGAAVSDLALVTGGSGIGAGLARHLAAGRAASPADPGLAPGGTEPGGTAPGGTEPWVGLPGRAVVLSGSSSVMTNRQVEHYRAVAPSLGLEVERVLEDGPAYAAEVLGWVLAAGAEGPAPLVFATARPERVRALQERFGVEAAGTAIEGFFGDLARALAAEGVQRFIVAGGESSGAVTAALGVSGFRLGPQIAPGVPWVRSLDGALDLALKSGNFGEDDFFTRAQRIGRGEERA